MKTPTQSNSYCQNDALEPSWGFTKSSSALFLTILLVFFYGLFGRTAFAADPQHVSFTLEGCRNDGTITLPINGQFVCPGANYTTGNLGKGWNELDLVPHRLSANAGNAAPANQTYTVAVVLDAEDAGHPGYDVISVPILNTGLSSATCSAPTVGAETILSPGLGGIDDSRYRLVTIAQAQNTTCVYDYYGRLALGSHLFPGSSLHANLADETVSTAGIGARDVSIPVKEILPQEISKDMSATQNASHTWEIQKGPQPATVSFGDVCAPDQDFQEPVIIHVTWTQLPATPTGDITVITHIFATNPASRVVTINVTDVIRSGTTDLDSANSGDIDVAANTANFLVLTHQTTVPAGTTNLNDIATATYTDKVTGVPVPGNTTATASATVQFGSLLNTTAIINDVESITGNGLTFSTDSFSGASGAFDGGYIAGAPTLGPVGWTSVSQNGNGFVDFDKTIYLDGKQVTSGILSDTATLNASDGFTAQATASVNISSTVFGKLTVQKSVPDVLESGEKLEVTLHIERIGGGYSNDVVLTFNPGEFLKSEVLTALQPGSYTVNETQTLFFEDGSNVGQVINILVSDGPKQSLELGAQQCEDTVTIVNTVPQIEPPRVRVQKTTEPLPGDPGFDPANDLVWEFTLNGTGIAAPGEVKTVEATADLGSPIYTLFDSLLEHGSYTITETLKTGWDLISATPPGGNATACTFDVNLEFPDYVDQGKIFTCIFHNVKRAEAKVIKTVSGQAPQNGDPGFVFQIRQGASISAVGTILESGIADFGNGGIIEFSILLVPGTTYQLCEVVMPGWTTTLGPPLFTVFNPDGDNSTVCTDFTAQPGEVKTFTIDNVPPPGGLARTIGFWKNWTSCDGRGNQDPVLDQTLVAAGGGILIGDLFVNNCDDAVDILDKSDVGSGQKKANDAAYGLAAQLLAAKLNIVAGAGSCAAANTAISAGQALLDLINFTGTGNYLPPTVKGALLKQQRSDALSLADTLDKYNNNLLCP
jgi:hypothetical protein